MATVYDDKKRRSDVKRNTQQPNNNTINNNNNKINNNRNVNNTNKNNNNNINHNKINNNDVDSNSNKSGGVVGKQLNRNPQQQKNDPPKKKPSLVREGLGSDNKPVPKPKAKVPPTRRFFNDPRTSRGAAAPNPAAANPRGSVATMRGAADGDGDSSSYRANGTTTNGSVGLENGLDGSNINDDLPPRHVGARDPSGPKKITPRGGGVVDKGNTTTPADVPSVRQRFYDSADMDDVLQDKIVHQLRENGVSETKVAYLSARIAQAVRDDVMMERKASTPLVMSNLTTALSDHLDAILYNSRNHTDLSHIKPHDTSELSQIILLRVAQVHEELDVCKATLDKALQSSRRFNKDGDRGGGGGGGVDGGPTTATTPRDHRDRSVVITIKEGILEQETQEGILVEQLTRYEKYKDELDQLTQKHAQEIQMWDDENLQLKKYLTEADQDNETLVSKVKAQQQENDTLTKTIQANRKEIERLQKQIDDLAAQGHVSGKELAALQSEKARLQVLCDQRYKEIIHLRDPDKDLLYQIRALNEEVTSLRTQTRRLSEEKGMLKSKIQKMEAALDESLKQRNKLTSERDGLFKENQEVRQKFRKLTLSTPAQRTLPEIMTPRSRASSRNTTSILNSTRTHSRADSSSVPGVKNSWSEDNTANKLPTHVEEINDV